MLIKIFLKYILGYVRITVEGYYIERFINICTTNKILIWNLRREKGVKLYLNVGIEDFYRAVKVAKKLKCKIKIEKKRGIPFLLNKYRKRKIFLISLIVIMMALYVSSNYIWNIEIQIEDNLELVGIKEDIEQAGLEVGMRKKTINTQEIANKIRLKRDDLSWIGINIQGTNAIIKAVKAKEAPEIIDENEYCNIVAKRGGTITQIIAQNGTAQVKVGDKVEEGQILIQGTMEGKYTGIRYVHSLGEVKGIVQYTKTEKFPLEEEQNVKTGNKEAKYRINFNNFQINFYKTLSKFKKYDTIEENKKIKLFSDFYLPIEILKRTNYEFAEENLEYGIEEAKEIGVKKAQEALNNQVQNKENIVNTYINYNEQEEFIEVEVTYEVLEEIGTKEKIVF